MKIIQKPILNRIGFCLFINKVNNKNNLMKKHHFVIAFIGILIITSVAYAGNWRPGEKQVLIEINSPQQIEQLNEWNINFEFVNTEKVRAYITPKDLILLTKFGFNFKTEIEDLNKHYEYFWLTKDAYHTYQEIIDLADSLETHFPLICKKYIFGTSMGGRQLATLKISDNVETDEPEAEVMFDGGIHGDEIGAAENVIRFARDICIDYGNDPTVTNLIDNREIWLYLMVNPDGREAMSRYNNNGVDLNRDWAYMWDGWGGSTGPCSQVESKALRECMYNNQFVVHTTYHSGTEYISCPWSYRSSTPHDMAHILQLAGVYSSVSGYSNMEYGQGNSGMYPINGSTKDSNYGIMGSISWSMEISYSKQPPTSQIMMYYNYNKPSMIAMIEYSGYGLDGTITDINTGNPIAGVVFVNDYFPTFSDGTVGDYHKYILPGTYSITVVANGYETQTINNVVVTENNSTTTDFQLQPEEGQYVYRFAASRIPGNNEADEGNTPAVIGAPDNFNYSIGMNGWCVLDMQYPVIDRPGSDFRVHEGDSSPEGFTCYVGETIDGPWYSLGTGNGITEFDISISGLPETQYIKIVDDGDGSANVADAGFDLDAIEAIEPVSGIYLAMTEYVVDDSGGNNNGKIDPGETVDIIVTLKNNGDITAENIEGVINTSSSYLTIVVSNANFGDLAQGESIPGIFTVTADPETPNGEQADIDLNVASNSGTYTNSFVMSFVIGQIPVLVVDMDENYNSGPAIKTAIEANGVSVEYITSFPTELNIYSSVFFCLGIYSNNYVLNSSEGQDLANYMNSGGQLYMEGGDTWYYDNQTAVHPMFNISATSDGSGDMNTVIGKAGTFTENMIFNYSGENNWMDHINAISPAFDIFENQSPVYGTGVAYDEGNYKTIGTSHEFGGLDDGTSPSTKTELMYEYLKFFGITGTSVNLTAFLEGPFVTTEMTTALNSSGHLPLTQPYNVSPWNYSGGETVASIPNTNIVDWVLIELRETPGDASSAIPSTMLDKKAGFILKNGSVVDLDGSSPLEFDISVTENLFAIVYHRNHLGIMSAYPLTLFGHVYSYNFTSGMGTVLGEQNGHCEIAPGIWGMMAGDANGDGEVDNKDKNDIWKIQMGSAGYLNGDFDMNGQVEMSDKIAKWKSNAGNCSFIVK
jgi:hypothetical protein